MVCGIRKKFLHKALCNPLCHRSIRALVDLLPFRVYKPDSPCTVIIVFAVTDICRFTVIQLKPSSKVAHKPKLPFFLR